MKSKDKDSFNKFSSAMDDLEDILADEGIDISPKKEQNKNQSIDEDQIPVLRTFKIAPQEPLANSINTESSPESVNTSISESLETVADENSSASTDSPAVDLDDYISDFDDDLIDIDSEKELEKAVESITNPDELYKFEHDELQHQQIDTIKKNLEKNFAQHLSQKTKAHHQEIETLEKDLKEDHSQELSQQLSQQHEAHLQQIEALKKELKKNLNKQVEKSVAKLKTNLLKSIESEIDKLFKKIYP